MHLLRKPTKEFASFGFFILSAGLGAAVVGGSASSLAVKATWAAGSSILRTKAIICSALQLCRTYLICSSVRGLADGLNDIVVMAQV